MTCHCLREIHVHPRILQLLSNFFAKHGKVVSGSLPVFIPSFDIQLKGDGHLTKAHIIGAVMGSPSLPTHRLVKGALVSREFFSSYMWMVSPSAESSPAVPLPVK